MQHLSLLLGEEAVVIQLVQVAQVGEDAVGIGQLLVDVIEIADEQLSPTEELIEGLFGTCKLTEGLIEVADQLDGVGNMERGLLTEEFADGDVGRTP